MAHNTQRMLHMMAIIAAVSYIAGACCALAVAAWIDLWLKESDKDL